MEQVSRKVHILWKYNPTAFEIINKDVVGEDSRKVGSSISAVTAILQHPEMLRLLMPQLLGDDPDSNNVNWDRIVRNYWDSLSVDIPSGGKILETGFNFDVDNYQRKEYIKELMKDKPIKTSKQLAEYVMGFEGTTPNIEEENRWKYGVPIEILDYLLWRYTLNYRPVANNIETVNKSPNIRFYLHTEEERERAKREAFKTKQTALNEYMKFMKDASIDDMNDVLSIISPSSIRELVVNTEVEEKQMAIMDLVTSDPNKFVNVIKDKNLKIRASIERLISFGILRQLPGTTTIVDSADPSVIVGNNMDNAVSYVLNEKNKVPVNEYFTKYKSLTIE